MSRLARYIAESSSDESSVQDRYDATSFGSQFDSDSSDSDTEPYKGRYSYESDQESQISLSPGEEYVLDTLFGWMDRPLCAAQQRQSLLLESARASAFQNITANRNLYLKAHAENSEPDSDSDSDSFITQEVEEYSEGPEESCCSEAKDAEPAPSKMEEDKGPKMEYEREEKEIDEPIRHPKSSKRERKVKPPVASPRGNKLETLQSGDIDLFHSESQDDESDSEEVVEQLTGPDDDTSAAHRVSFLNAVLEKKEQKVKNEVLPSNFFESPIKKTSKAAENHVPIKVKISEGKAVDVPADPKVVASSKKAHSQVPQKSSAAPEEKLSEIPAEVPLEVSVAMETATGVPAEIQTHPETPKKTRARSPPKLSPMNVDEEINDELAVDKKLEKSSSLEFLVAKIAQQQNTPRNRSNRDPTPTRREARSFSREEEEDEVNPEIDQHLQDQQVQEIIEIDIAASREPPVGYSPRSPHLKKNKETERLREPRRKSKPDPTDVSDPFVRLEPDVVEDETTVAAAKAEPIKATRAKRLSSKQKSKKMKVSNIHPGQPQHEDEIESSSPMKEVVGPVGSITVEELKETLSALSNPQIQQNQPIVKEESRHIRVQSIDLIDLERSQAMLLQQPQSRHKRCPSDNDMEPQSRSIEETLALRKSQSRSAPILPSSPRRRHEASPVTQKSIIQFGSPLPTNNKDNPIDIEAYMAQREMLNREATRLGNSITTATRASESPAGVREEVESPRQPPSPRTPSVRQVARGRHSGNADLNAVPNKKPYGKSHKQRNCYFEADSPRQANGHNNHDFCIRQPKQFDALARNDPAGHIIDHQYETKNRSKKSSSGKSKSNLASIDDLKKLEKRIEAHFRNSFAGENDNRSAVSTKELRKLERQLVLQLRRVEEKRAAKLERLRSKKARSRHNQDIVEAEVIAVVEPKEEAARRHLATQKTHAGKNSGDFRDANRFEQLQALRLSKEMGRYMSKQSGLAAESNRHFQEQAY